MKFSLIDEFEVTTSFSREELVAVLLSKISPALSAREARDQALADILYRAKVMQGESPWVRHIRGHVTRDEFSMTRGRDFRRSVARGKLRSMTGGTAVAVAMSPHPIALLPLGFMLFVASLIVLGLFTFGVHRTPNFWFLFVAGLVLAAGILFTVRVRIRSVMARQRAELEDWIQSAATRP